MNRLTPWMAALTMALTVPTIAEAQRGRPANAQKAQLKAQRDQHKAMLKQNVQAAKNMARIGKQAIKRAEADERRLVKEERSLRTPRLQSRQKLAAAHQAYRADRTAENRQAWIDAYRVYKPQKQAHETAMTQMRRARGDVILLKSIQLESMNTLKDANTALRIKPAPNVRPRVSAAARSQAQPQAAAVVPSSVGIYGPIALRGRTHEYAAFTAGRNPYGAGPPPRVVPRINPVGGYDLVMPPASAPPYDLVPRLTNGTFQSLPLRQNVYEQPSDTLVP